MSRRDRREEIFLDNVDRQDFLKTLAEADDDPFPHQFLNLFEPTLPKGSLPDNPIISSQLTWHDHHSPTSPQIYKTKTNPTQAR
jgi:hypothetical protein